MGCENVFRKNFEQGSDVVLSAVKLGAARSEHLHSKTSLVKEAAGTLGVSRASGRGVGCVCDIICWERAFLPTMPPSSPVLESLKLGLAPHLLPMIRISPPTPQLLLASITHKTLQVISSDDYQPPNHYYTLIISRGEGTKTTAN